jgi:sortase A
VGLLLVAVYLGVRTRQRVVAKNEIRRFESAKDLARGKAPAPEKPLSWRAPDQSLWAPERIKAWQQSSTAAKTAAVAVLRIPRIGLEVPVLEGTDDATLDRGAGHIEGTPVPGSRGNVGIAGHRDGFFRVLKDVSAGDAIEMETPTGTHRYVVDTLVLVDPQDTWVLDDTADRRLTLVTCYPFYYSGSAPRRYIVGAVETSFTP